MKYRLMIAALALTVTACGDNNETNNGTTNNTTSTNNGTANNTTATNNTTSTNNGTANNTTATNNTTSTNNGTANNTANNDTTGALDYISADVDGTAVLADSEEGGIEPMGETVQLRKTTADGAGGGTVEIFRISLPDTSVAAYDCATDDVTVTYSTLDGQLINNWVASETCAIEITESGDTVVGTFSGSATDGATTVELTNGEFSLTAP